MSTERVTVVNWLTGRGWLGTSGGWVGARVGLVLREGEESWWEGWGAEPCYAEFSCMRCCGEEFLVNILTVRVRAWHSQSILYLTKGF